MTYIVRCEYGCNAVVYTTTDDSRAEWAAMAHAVNNTGHSTTIEESE